MATFRSTTDESLFARIRRKLVEVRFRYASFLALRRLFRPGLFEYADMYVLTLDLIPSPNDGDSWPTLGGQGRLLRARDAFFERSSG
jgi:hypothetical protein